MSDPGRLEAKIFSLKLTASLLLKIGGVGVDD